MNALLLGERKEKIRARGRLYQRLIKEQIDISTIQNRLLDPDFDLAAWLKAHLPVEKTVSPASTTVKSSAELRRAHAVTESMWARGPEAEAAAPVEAKTIASLGLSVGQHKIVSVRDYAERVAATLERDHQRWEDRKSVV